MPVTKSAKRALRGSARKQSINKLIVSKLETAIRIAKKSKISTKILSAMSLTDKAAKKKVIHKNKAARIKSRLAKLMPTKPLPKTSKKVKK